MESAWVLAMTIVDTMRPVLHLKATNVLDDFDLFDNMDMFLCTLSTNHEEEENSREKISKTQKYFTCQPSCEAE